METLLQRIYDELKYTKRVQNQTDFGEKLGYNKSYTSTLLKSVAEITEKVQDKLIEVFQVNPIRIMLR